MSTADRDAFVEWVRSRLEPAEIALHNGDADPRRALWSRHDPVTVLGAWKDAGGQEEVADLFALLERSLTNCTSYEFDMTTFDVIGDVAYTVGYEHTQASIDGQPQTYTLRATQIYRREAGEWKVVHRHADNVRDR